MREEGTLHRVHHLNLMHLIFRERRVEHIKILFHAFFFYRFGNDSHAALHEEAQIRLCGSFAITAANCFQYFIKTYRFFSSANGHHDSSCMPYFFIKACAVFCC